MITRRTFLAGLTASTAIAAVLPFAKSNHDAILALLESKRQKVTDAVAQAMWYGKGTDSHVKGGLSDLLA